MSARYQIYFFHCFVIFSCIQVSPEKMRGEGSREENLRLRRLAMELLWLVSVEAPPERGVSTRQMVLRIFREMLRDNYSGARVSHNDIDFMLPRGVGNMPVSFVTELQTILNAQDGAMGPFRLRDRLLRLISDMLETPPSASVATNDHEDISDLTAHYGENTAIEGNVRGLSTALPDIGRMNLEAVVMPPATVADEDDDGFAGGLPISEATPEDDPPAEVYAIVAIFRAGNYTRLQQAYQRDAVITALSSSLAVMRSLLVEPAGGDAPDSGDFDTSLEAQEGGADEEAKEEQADDGAP